MTESPCAETVVDIVVVVTTDVVTTSVTADDTDDDADGGTENAADGDNGVVTDKIVVSVVYDCATIVMLVFAAGIASSTSETAVELMTESVIAWTTGVSGAARAALSSVTRSPPAGASIAEAMLSIDGPGSRPSEKAEPPAPSGAKSTPLSGPGTRLTVITGDVCVGWSTGDGASSSAGASSDVSADFSTCASVVSMSGVAGWAALVTGAAAASAIEFVVAVACCTGVATKATRVATVPEAPGMAKRWGCAIKKLPASKNSSATKLAAAALRSKGLPTAQKARQSAQNPAQRGCFKTVGVLTLLTAG
jgi:hypothetical protein